MVDIEKLKIDVTEHIKFFGSILRLVQEYIDPEEPIYVDVKIDCIEMKNDDLIVVFHKYSVINGDLDQTCKDIIFPLSMMEGECWRSEIATFLRTKDVKDRIEKEKTDLNKLMTNNSEIYSKIESIQYFIKTLNPSKENEVLVISSLQSLINSMESERQSVLNKVRTIKERIDVLEESLIDDWL